MSNNFTVFTKILLKMKGNCQSFENLMIFALKCLTLDFY